MTNNYRPDYSAKYEIEIFAPPDKVWDFLSRVEMWTIWRQDVSCAYWKTGEGENGTLKWRLKKLIGFTAIVDEWRQEREMRWNAVSYRTNVHHMLTIDGDYRSTKIRLDVSGNGGLLKFFMTRVPFTHYLNRSNEILLGALKTKLEAGKDDSMEPPSGTMDPFQNNVRLPSQRTEIDH